MFSFSFMFIHIYKMDTRKYPKEAELGGREMYFIVTFFS
jgi:hypothetical protein